MSDKEDTGDKQGASAKLVKQPSVSKSVTAVTPELASAAAQLGAALALFQNALDKHKQGGYMNIRQLKDWSTRTRSDINPIKDELEQGNYETAKALIGDVLESFDELDKLLLTAENKE